jgi:hypothetical protein
VLDFCRKVDRDQLSRQDVLLLIKLGAFGWTGLSRRQLALAKLYYKVHDDRHRLCPGHRQEVCRGHARLGDGRVAVAPRAARVRLRTPSGDLQHGFGRQPARQAQTTRAVDRAKGRTWHCAAGGPQVLDRGEGADV